MAFCLTLILPSLAIAGNQDGVLRSAAEVSRRLGTRSPDNSSFVLLAKVTAIRREPNLERTHDRIDALGLEDETGATLIICPTDCNVNVVEGDIVRAEGRLAQQEWSKALDAILTHLTKLGHETPAQPLPASFQSIQDGALDYRVARLTGTVRDASRSDSNYDWVILKLVIDNDHLIDVSVQNVGGDHYRLLPLIGSTVQVVGIVTPYDRSLRTKMGRIFWCWSDRNIKQISRPDNSPHTPPDIRALDGLHPSTIQRKGRHRAVGQVLATWHGDKILLRTEKDEICRIELADAQLPACNTCIEAVGFPESDLYHLNLVRATWEGSSIQATADKTIVATSVRDILVGPWLPGVFNMINHGKLIRIVGTVRSLPDNDNGDGILYLQEDQTTFPVDISSNPQIVDSLSVGCQIEATGVCVIDTPNWTPNALCQKLDRFFLVIRNPDDIKILSRPSWWTPVRLLAAIGILLFFLIAILIWNRSLIVLAERRGRELLREQIGHIRANLKVDERTRLAVDLHDALSQNLTGIALQLDLVSRLTDTGNPKVVRHLGIATRTLQSCRNELRACIWDLRNQALDEPSVEDAIRTTLTPHLDAARLSVRFKVPRARLDDNTTHAMLRIVRELASNAIRHGQAKSIRIAGALDGGRLRISVQDDGIGFDPSSRPNIKDGHFGLDGITERIRAFNGKIEIASAPGQGTKIAVTLDLPCTGKENIEHG